MRSQLLIQSIAWLKRCVQLLRPYSKIIAVGLLLRLLLMPFAIQGDIVFHTWIANFIIHGHLNVYNYYFQQVQRANYPPRVIITPFPPMFYVLDGAYLFILERLRIFSFLGVWTTWNIPSAIIATLGNPATSIGRTAYSTQNRVFFFLKVPYLLFDIFGLVALLGVLEREDRKAGVAAWMLNPFILYVTYGWGQTDILAASLTMAALYLVKRMMSTKRVKFGLLACLALGFAASFKPFALALLPIFSLFASKNTKTSWFQFFAAGLSPFILAIPFISQPFLQMILAYGGYLTARNFNLPWGSQFTIYVAFAVYLALIYYLLVVEDFSFDNLLTACLIVFSALYGLTVWLPNWFLWGMPFVLLALLRRPKLIGVYLLTTVFYFVFVQAWGNVLWLGLFFPLTDMTIVSGPLGMFPNLWEVLPNYFTLLVGLAYTGIGTSMVFITYYTAKYEQVRKHVRIRPIQWSIALLIPILMGGLSVFIDRARLLGENITGTFLSKVFRDPVFFGFYFVLIGLCLVWLVVNILSKPKSEHLTL